MAKASQFLNLVDKKGEMVKGECIDAKHLNEIMVTAWNWHAEDPAAVQKKKKDAKSDPEASKVKTKVGSQGETGDAIKPSPFGISKPTDRSTVRLMRAMDSGEIFPTATLVIEEEYKDSPRPFRMEILLTDVFFIDLKWSASAGSAGMDFDESWDLNYRRIELKYLWWGEGRGWIPALFERRPDSAHDASKKSPLSPAEQKAAVDKRIADAVAAQSKKTGK
jgi:type VI protein secretion system component Hcp